MLLPGDRLNFLLTYSKCTELALQKSYHAKT